jgi:hypothetical protein
VRKKRKATRWREREAATEERETKADKAKKK